MPWGRIVPVLPKVTTYAEDRRGQSASMDTPPSPAPGQTTWGERIAESLSQQQARANEFFAALQQRMERAEEALGQQFQQIEDELSAERDETRRLTVAYNVLRESTRMDTPHVPSPEQEAWAKRFMESLGRQQARASEFLDAFQERLEQAEACVEETLEEYAKEWDAHRDEIGRLTAERDELTARLSALEAQLAEAERERNELSSRGEQVGFDEDLQRRYDLAIEDVQTSRAKIAELQQQLTKARSSAAKLAQHSREPGWLDWETEKRRIIDALEADSDQEDEAKKTERMGIEEVLRMTDEVIAAKEQELQEIRQQLDDQGRISTVIAAETATIKQAISADAAIREERERLQQLQKEWLEKLRQAEVELSLERAKIARERADMDEQLREAKNASPNAQDKTDAQGPTVQSVRGRWLAQLGLSASDREPKRRP